MFDTWLEALSPKLCSDKNHKSSLASVYPDCIVAFWWDKLKEDESYFVFGVN